MKEGVMNATNILMEEHRVIERVLAALEAAVERLEKGDPVAPSFFLRAADFIKGFADGCHHHKEEDVLFPAMREAGIPSAGGPVGVMLEEHAEARQLAAAMRAGAERMESGETGAHDDVARSALGYVALLRMHIEKEDQASSTGQRNASRNVFAGVANPKVFRGRSLSWRAILFSSACE